MQRQRVLQLRLLLPLCLLLLLPGGLGKVPRFTKICKSLEITQLNYTRTRNVTQLKAALKDMVGDCQYVHGNLNIYYFGVDPETGRVLDDNIRNMETDFLDSVIEISGRLVLRQVALRRVQLRNLTVIRGYSTTESDDATLQIEVCPHPMELLLPRLSAIYKGDVRLVTAIDNDLYCRLRNTIDWPALFQDREKKQSFLDSGITCPRGSVLIGNCSCEAGAISIANCSADCHRGNCWSPDVCQAITPCLRNRCKYGCYRDRETGEAGCCHEHCLGGCTGPESSACRSCKRVNLNGECRDDCEQTRMHYNPVTMAMEENQNSPLVQVGNVCVEKCPSQFLVDISGRYCLAACPLSQIPMDGKCTNCLGDSGGKIGCRICSSDDTRSIDNTLAVAFADCNVWKFAHSVFFDGSHVNVSDGIVALRSARYIYAESLSIRRTEFLVANLSSLSSLRHVSGELYLMNLQASFLGLVSLETAKKLVLFRVSGLCKAWYPERYLEQQINSTRRYEVKAVQVTFAADDEPACSDATCDIQCRDAECWGPGPAMCVACLGVRVNGVCHPDCRSAGAYSNPAAAQPECLSCHPQCGPGGCGGPDSDQCATCRNYRNDGECVARCGSHLEPGSDGICYSATAARFAGLAAGLALLLLVLLVAGCLGWRYYRRRVRKYEAVELDEYLADPSNPTDMAKLLVVNDDDIMKQKEIGSGAFGTVYKGKLRADTVKGVRELPVAIKVLRGSNPKLGQELLNEASVLARVQHPHCARLVALCLTAEVQLITALMPRGCLLNFLRDRRGGIGAERMLSWALQVAEGMAYLESINIVHRDLAARNVLLKTADDVKITDFGLARLLNESEREFLYTSGALPVKWLGIECFESGVFSHKSDVWSYGVLLWEICSYGDSPYKPYRISSVEDITTLLKKGVRLNQPDVCSVDFYNVMLACWLPYPESRPSFSDLTATMKDCMLYPSKYIASRSGVEEVDMEKVELVHAMVQHSRLPESRQQGAGGGYTPMSVADDDRPDGQKEGAGMVPVTGAKCERPVNAYVNEPSARPLRPVNGCSAGGAQDATASEYLVPRQSGTADEAAGAEVGYLVPRTNSPGGAPSGQGQQPVDLDDDYLAPTKC